MRLLWDLRMCSGCQALSRGLTNGTLAKGGGWSQVPHPAALPNTATYASGRVGFTLLKAARYKGNSPAEAAGCDPCL